MREHKKPNATSERLRLYRKKCGFSVAEVAKKLNVSASTYRDWEYGRQIKGEPYMKLAEIYGVSLMELLAGRNTDKDQIFKDLDEIESLCRKIRMKF